MGTFGLVIFSLLQPTRATGAHATHSVLGQDSINGLYNATYYLPPADNTAVDNSKSMYMGCAWEESKSKSHIGNLLSAFHYFVPSILANTFSLATK